MDWSKNLQQFQHIVVFKFPQAPYFLLLISLLISLVCGLPFAITLQERVEDWIENHSSSTLPRWGKLQLLIPFIGISIGVYIAFASLLEILGLTTLPSYLLSLLGTTFLCLWVWSEIGNLLFRKLLRSYLDKSSKLSHQR
ncbi:hypothetical protein [Umezakia ovalisporum]|uniref:Uncharacterized protein n=1 Tax=Umezakia ovalisporum FSS-43 TaxID=2740520 RepID=A0ABT6K1R2_9CYAN|nr:hypothetical protein [Umezakia ovalisporum]MDH6056253.1 hypothetical protein [Umezakia ovalisporum FSS-43]MDH6067791.1 hypothetical protein [Umezakia ovalisporum APH033B]MDH6070901.1 hypothetical protein [Umezakia ovalisporum CobakiLakeA]MDH6074502.1 hypothetical protein [Umezakia ovalisporum CS-1034]MDH6079135.1 hypothetical protein [Umezakia ovalisporum FSS-45]